MKRFFVAICICLILDFTLSSCENTSEESTELSVHDMYPNQSAIEILKPMQEETAIREDSLADVVQKLQIIDEKSVEIQIFAGHEQTDQLIMTCELQKYWENDHTRRLGTIQYLFIFDTGNMYCATEYIDDDVKNGVYSPRIWYNTEEFWDSLEEIEQIGCISVDEVWNIKDRVKIIAESGETERTREYYSGKNYIGYLYVYPKENLAKNGPIKSRFAIWSDKVSLSSSDYAGKWEAVIDNPSAIVLANWFFQSDFISLWDDYRMRAGQNIETDLIFIE